MTAARWFIAALLTAMGLLAVFRVPHGVLWKPAVGATAFGVWLLPMALLVWLPEPRDGASGLALIGAVLLLSPWLRAQNAVHELEDRVRSSFGETPWTGNGLASRTAPVALAPMLKLGAAGPSAHRRVFDEHNHLGLELYDGAGPGPHPVVVAIHGGSWNSGEPSQLSAVYRYLAARGITVAAVSYRFAPEHVFPAQQDDIESALAWLRANAEELDTDPERTVLMGRSAGGHLALLAAYTTDDPGIRGVVALYPPTDLHWSWDHPTNPLVLDSKATLREFLGGSPAEVPKAFDAASPIGFVTADSPPTLLIHGTRDELVFAEQSRRLASRLAKAQVPHALVETGWDTHGLDANLGGPGGQIYIWSLERFLGYALHKR